LVYVAAAVTRWRDCRVADAEEGSRHRRTFHHIGGRNHEDAKNKGF